MTIWIVVKDEGTSQESEFVNVSAWSSEAAADAERDRLDAAKVPSKYGP